MLIINIKKQEKSHLSIDLEVGNTVACLNRNPTRGSLAKNKFKEWPKLRKRACTGGQYVTF